MIQLSPRNRITTKEITACTGISRKDLRCMMMQGDFPLDVHDDLWFQDEVLEWIALRHQGKPLPSGRIPTQYNEYTKTPTHYTLREFARMANLPPTVAGKKLMRSGYNDMPDVDCWGVRADQANEWLANQQAEKQRNRQ